MTLPRILPTYIAAALAAALAPGAAAQDASGFAVGVDSVFERWNTTSSPGCAVAASREGETVLARAYGMADLEHDVPNTPRTIFEAGSVSKQFAAAAVVLLALDGRLSLEDDVRRYVPELPDYGDTIRIRHLLNHTSGLRDWGSVAAIGGWGRSARTHTHDHVLDILSRQRALNFRPGTEYSYSNSGYNLLAIVVDRVSGMPFAEFSRRRIFEPLGMEDTQWRDRYRRIVKGRASAYGATGDTFFIDRPIENVHGNGGLLTTVHDLLTWNRALETGRLGGPGFVELMHRTGVLNDGTAVDYASGLRITEYDGIPEIGHTGATSGYRAFLARYPERGVGVAVLCNVAAVNPGLVGRRVADVLLGRAGPEPDADGRGGRAGGERDREVRTVSSPGEYAGEYHSPDAETTLTVRVEDGDLVLFQRPATRLPLRPLAADTFQSPAGRITFVRGADGEVVQLSVRQPRVYDLRFDRVGRGPGAAAAALRPHARTWERLVAAEDARAETPAQLDLLRASLNAPAPEIRRVAVRALGRLERPDLVDEIAPLLSDGAAEVRAAAAHALALAVQSGDEPAPESVRSALLQALERERSRGAAFAAIAESVGRIRHGTPARRRAVAGMLEDGLDGGETARIGALRGLYFLARQDDGGTAFDTRTRNLLRGLSTAPASGSPRVRALATAVLAAAGAADESLLASVLEDPEPHVRREAVAAMLTARDTAAARRIAARALADRSPVVRYEALRLHARRITTAADCTTYLALARDSAAHVALLALDLAGGACTDDARAGALLDSLAAGLPEAGHGSWHRAAHALGSLARVAPAAAQARLQAFAVHPNLFVRTRAADVAGVLADTATLRRLALDSHPNVRTAAVRGLSRVAGSAADPVYLAQLEREDSELLQAAAAALAGSGAADAPAALLDALDRLTLRGMETSRDARRALLERARELGTSSLAGRLRPYLSDFDPAIAALAADVIGGWTGTRPDVAPRQAAMLPLPTFEEAVALERARFRVELLDGGTFELRLFPFSAPTNAARFARLATHGYYDGLTFHRIVPNFIVQGGSPTANEYSGDGPFTRDELGRSNWRGTVGLSTRGRDTGDAQLYINTVDNVRLDHEYTVFAEVTEGMDVIDRLLEGAVIRRIVRQ